VHDLQRPGALVVPLTLVAGIKGAGNVIPGPFHLSRRSIMTLPAHWLAGPGRVNSSASGAEPLWSQVERRAIDGASFERRTEPYERPVSGAGALNGRPE
jgi:hypothetical protein